MDATTQIVETRRFVALPQNEEEVQHFLSQVLDRFSVPFKVRNDLRLAVEELFINVASYAYGDADGSVDVTVGVDEGRRDAWVRLADEGVPFDPFSVERDRARGSVEDVDVGGLGILLVKRLMDECLYKHNRGRNETTVVKFWEEPGKKAEDISHAASSINVIEKLGLNDPDKSTCPLTDDDLNMIVGGLTVEAEGDASLERRNRAI